MQAQAIIIQRAGGYDRLTIDSVVVAPPAAGSVTLAVRSIGVNYADCVVRMGLYASAKTYVGWPITPGFEVCGTVTQVGAGVTRVREGDTVIAVTRFGGYCTAVTVPEAHCFPLPAGWTPIEAAAFPAVSLTAYYALFELAHPHRGATALVHSAAGGIGGALLQLLRLRGVESCGVVGRSDKIAEALARGADTVIDKSTQPLWSTARARVPDGFDLVLDANGASTLRDSYAHLAPGGKLVVYGFHSMLPKQGGRPNWVKLAADYLRTPRFNPLEMTGSNKSVLAFNLSYLFEQTRLLQRAMDDLLGWAADGHYTPPTVTEYAFDDVASAHRALESGRTVGKLVLVVPQSD